MLGKGEDPIEDDAFDDDWERLFPRDEEEEEGGGGGEQPDRGAELEHEGEGTNDNEAPEMPGEAPQEAEGEAVAEGEDGLVKIHYHWESLPSDGAFGRDIALVLGSLPFVRSQTLSGGLQLYKQL